MGEVRKTFLVDAPAAIVWAALAAARVQSEGFEVEVRLEGGAACGFAGSACARQILAAFDAELRRTVAIGGRRIARHAATLDVRAQDANRSCLIWTHNVWPHGVPNLGVAMDASAGALTRMFAPR